MQVQLCKKRSWEYTKYDYGLQPPPCFFFDKHLREAYSVKAANSFIYNKNRLGIPEKMCVAN